MLEISLQSSRLATIKAKAQDLLEEINLGEDGSSRPIYISRLFDLETRARFVCLLQEFKNCFAWEYSELSGFDRRLVEHRLSIKDGYKPYR